MSGVFVLISLTLKLRLENIFVDKAKDRGDHFHAAFKHKKLFPDIGGGLDIEKFLPLCRFFVGRENILLVVGRSLELFVGL